MYYYKDSNGSKYAFKQEVISTDKITYIPIIEEEFNYEEISSIEKIWNEINYLKNQLFQTDYQAIKFAEGLLTIEEYEPIKQQRQNWRNQINQLEEQLKQEQ